MKYKGMAVGGVLAGQQIESDSGFYSVPYFNSIEHPAVSDISAQNAIQTYKLVQFHFPSDSIPSTINFWAHPTSLTSQDVLNILSTYYSEV